MKRLVRPIVGVVILTAVIALVLWGSRSVLSDSALEGIQNGSRVELHDEEIPRELILAKGMRAANGDLFVTAAVEHLDGTGSYQVCYFDASVALKDSRVKWIVSADDEGLVEHGQLVKGVPEEIARGEVPSIAVHLDDEGNVVAGYRFCEEIQDQP
jgi:hypothetical protein